MVINNTNRPVILSALELYTDILSGNIFAIEKVIKHSHPNISFREYKSERDLGYEALIKTCFPELVKHQAQEKNTIIQRYADERAKTAAMISEKISEADEEDLKLTGKELEVIEDAIQVYENIANGKLPEAIMHFTNDRYALLMSVVVRDLYPEAISDQTISFQGTIDQIKTGGTN